MARNIFISYKYNDQLVGDLTKIDIKYINGKLDFVKRPTRARDYVDKLQEILKQYNHINLGERDGESLEHFSDEKITSELKEKIRQSSTTIVLISKGMKEAGKPENDQWIPWEISYSLRTTTVQQRKSHRNAVLGVVIPDENNSYDWYYRYNTECNSITHLTDQLFGILKENMFNIFEQRTRECRGTKIHEGECSYIKTVKWEEFCNYSEWYIEKALEIQSNGHLYDIHINL